MNQDQQLREALAIIEKYGMKDDVIYREIAALSAKETEPKKCDECHGTGRVEESHRVDNSGRTVAAFGCCDSCGGTGEALTATQQAAQKRVFAKHQPCGCVVCTCEDDERCHGCGARNCGGHAVGEFPNPVYADQPQQAVPSQGAGELPPLPDPLDAVLVGWRNQTEMLTPRDDYYNADQMRDYARAALLEASEQREQPIAWMWQHDETGRTGFVETSQLNVWEQLNPRLKIVAPLYTTPPTPPAGVPDEEKK